jgi:PEP-CTERM/exosortase A-associated glycosyltransferase
MKILHVLDHSIPLHSGYSFRTLSILREQRALGWSTVQLTSPKHTLAGPPREDVDGFTFYRTPALTGSAAKLPVLNELALIAATAARLEEVVRLEQPDIIHAHSPVLNALASLRVARRLGLPVVYEVRAFWEDAAVDLGHTKENGPRYRLTRAIETLALRRCDAITTICQGLQQDLIKRQLPRDKITIIPNAVDPSEFAFGRTDDPSLRAKLDLADKVVLGFIGSFYAYEGLDLLIRALPLVLARRQDIVVLLVGGGPAEERLKALALELGVAEAVRFVGRVPHKEVQLYYDLVDIFVYPRHSMRLTELVTPLKPLEAMARGRLVLASDVGGHKELIRDRQTGFHFKSGDAQGLAGAVIQLLEFKAKWPGIQCAARRFVEDERTWKRSVAGYADVYGPLVRMRQLAS